MSKTKKNTIDEESNVGKKVYDFESDPNDFFKGSGKLKKKMVEDEEVDDEDDIEYDEDEPKSRSKITKIIFVCILLSITFLLVWAFNSPTFIINEITIYGQELKSYEEVQNIVQHLSGENIFLKDLGKVETEILKIPYVKTAKVKRSLPSKIEVFFEERAPFAMVKKNDEYFILDQEGYIIEIDLVDNVYDIPTITGLITDYEVSGDQISSIDVAKLKNIVFLLNCLDNTNFEYKINNIDYSTIDGISFSIENTELAVKYGDLNKNEANEKLVYLKEIIKKAIEQNLSGTIDITSDKYYEKSVLINNL